MSEEQQRLALIGQIIRFGLSGGLVTLFMAGGYWFVATILHVDPNLALLLVFLVAAVFGYILHSEYSFRGHGARDRVHVRTVRFFITTSLGFVANQFFVWLLVKHMGGPTWWPIVPMVFVTPVFTFTLNRRWVFG